jgi:hypothetical protein
MVITAELLLSDGTQNVSVELTSHAIAALAARLLDSSSQTGIFDILAEHTNFEVRLAVAGMENLTTEAIGRLAADSSLSVVRQLLKSKSARPKLTPQQVLAIVERDPELAGFVAAVIEDFTLDDDTVLSYFESHSDTYVRTKLAGNPFAGNAVLRRLAASDADANVRRIAADILA